METNTSQHEPIPDFQWQVHLARNDAQRLRVVVVALVIVPVLGYLLMRHWLFAVVGFWMLFSACIEYLLPIQYILTKDEVRQRTGLGTLGLKVMRWSDVKRVVEGKGGVLLTPFAQPSRLDAFRGIFLWFGDHEIEVREQLAARGLAKGYELLKP